MLQLRITWLSAVGSLHNRQYVAPGSVAAEGLRSGRSAQRKGLGAGFAHGQRTHWTARKLGGTGARAWQVQAAQRDDCATVDWIVVAANPGVMVHPILGWCIGF